LFPLTLFSHAYIGLAKLAYKLGLKTAVKLPVPVIVVGNVMVGGTGKTPVVIHLAQRLTQMGWQVGVIARGHGGHHADCTEVTQQSLAREVGDEALLLKHRLGLPVFIGKRRAQAALRLMQTYPQTQLIISDDGLQHLALHHDIALCVFDDRGLGNGFLLPAGPLRESWPRQLGEGVVQMTVHTGGKPFQGSLSAHRQLAGYAVNGLGEQRALHTWQHQAVDALAAIAQPELFFSALRETGLLLAHTQSFPDHDPLSHWQPPFANNVFCTEKDAVKLWPDHPDVWAVPLQCDLPSVFWEELMPHLHRLSLAHGHQTA
jgi:tetraacyldisaccharide 4'-kinase